MRGPQLRELEVAPRHETKAGIGSLYKGSRRLVINQRRPTSRIRLETARADEHAMHRRLCSGASLVEGPQCRGNTRRTQAYLNVYSGFAFKKELCAGGIAGPPPHAAQEKKHALQQTRSARRLTVLLPLHNQPRGFHACTGSFNPPPHPTPPLHVCRWARNGPPCCPTLKSVSGRTRLLTCALPMVGAAGARPHAVRATRGWSRWRRRRAARRRGARRAWRRPAPGRRPRGAEGPQSSPAGAAARHRPQTAGGLLR